MPTFAFHFHETSGEQLRYTHPPKREKVKLKEHGNLIDSQKPCSAAKEEETCHIQIPKPDEGKKTTIQEWLKKEVKFYQISALRFHLVLSFQMASDEICSKEKLTSISAKASSFREPPSTRHISSPCSPLSLSNMVSSC